MGLLSAFLVGPSRCEPTAPSADAGPIAQAVMCGTKACATGDVCCDTGCGLCASSTEACGKQQCPPRGDAGSVAPPVTKPGTNPGTKPGTNPGTKPATKAVQCGGFAGRPCPGLGRCEDDPSDGCDPKRGGADCGGLCICDAKAKCMAGQSWNADPSACTCEGGDPAADAGPAAGEACGKSVCAKGEVCCNPSCSTCVAPGQGCTKQLCVDEPAGEKVFCGGIAGFQCAGGGQCVDDPSDSCDPKRGGADCGGMCVCTKGPSPCPGSSRWNPSPKVCGCEPTDSAGGTGERCGANTCATGQVCCNASCGVCTPGGACTQQLCN